MPNTFLTTKLIAREALPILKENLVFPNLIHTDYSSTFQHQGDTIRIRKPNTFEAKDFDTQIEVQDITDDSLDVTLDKIADVSTELTSKELTLNLEDFNNQITLPACIAIAEKINREGLALYKDIPYLSGTAGTTPSSLTDFANASKVLNINKVPLSERRTVWDPNADCAFKYVPAIVNAEKSGTTKALREGNIGRIFGFDSYMAQSVGNHETGITAFTTVKCGASASAGATTISLSGTSIAGKLVKGDVITIANKNYTVTEDTETAAANAISTVKIYPGLATNVTTTTAVTKVANHTANLAFHKNAFAFVTRPLAAAPSVDCTTISYEGLNIRVTKGYNMNTKKLTISFDTLYGYKTIFPELATRVMG